jgi:hypothetical protein
VGLFHALLAGGWYCLLLLGLERVVLCPSKELPIVKEQSFLL